MSEEEIINIFNTVFIANRFDGIYTSVGIIIEAMQGLLDLYNKEKIRNSIITNWFGTAPTYEDGKYLNYISKDKIRERIKELEDLNSEFSQRVIKSKEVYLTELVQNILKELLED